MSFFHDGIEKKKIAVTSFRQNPGKGVALPCDELSKDTISILVVKWK